ncbi:MAG: FtsW/RodA/SpoVE family cell cycle protein [Candidatus Yanofskybacteria bacterium]|nr:FtsW/RodA/SpoVE family cell cycle protein [Candidatus Yanofskybacteria bacterium]
MDLKRSFRTFSSNFRQLDLPLLATAVAILLFSLLNLYGIDGPGQFFYRHAIFTGIGIALMIAISFLNYRYLKNYSMPVLIFFGLTVILLAWALLSPAIRGSHSWIVLGNYQFEPSELAKIAFIAVLAKYFSQRHSHINQFRHIAISGTYLVILLGMILAQPDLGSAVLLSVLWGGMLLAAGINKRHFFLLMIVTVFTAYLGWIFALEPYQKERLVAFVNPYDDPTGIGYNIIQSKIAIGSGHWLGNGLGKGSQAGLGFLPEAHNDFAFASLAEQFGLLGMIVLLGLVFLMVARILRIGERAQNNFGKLFCLGMAIIITMHAIVNAAINLGLMPITGIPFTFLSYGGSHLLAVAMGLGTVLSIKRYA